MGQEHESFFFIASVTHLRHLSHNTHEEKSYCFEMAKGLHKRFLIGDAQINVSGTMRKKIAAALNTWTVATATSHVHIIFKETYDEIVKLIRTNTLARFQTKKIGRFLLGIRFIWAGDHQSTMRPLVASKIGERREAFIERSSTKETKERSDIRPDPQDAISPLGTTLPLPSTSLMAVTASSPFASLPGVPEEAAITH